MPFARCLLSLFICALLLPGTSALAQVAAFKIDPVPAEVSSNHFRVTVNGRSSNVLHAATGYYLLNFSTSGPVTVTVTAHDPHYWDAGVEVQPMRLGIRPVRHGATITFRLNGPEKLTISRPGDHFAKAEILFLFANRPETKQITAATPGIRYYGPGAHHENIDAHTGDTIYLAPGAVIFGSLNIWQVQHVHVFGTGTILYDGPQNPHDDTGWIHKQNWHVIVMDNADDIEIDGITCITRSRSWQIQMKDSRHIGFYNVKVIGGNPNNANQDGMDWLGGGDTTVRNSFLRASDDNFAMYGNWDGYDPEVLRKPGPDVTDITIEDTEVSTSISNTVRVNWPGKTFNSAHFHMRDIDVLSTGFGACKIPFAFFELWSDPDGKGSHTDYTFTDIRLEDWYSLFQIRQPLPRVRDIAFRDVWAMDGPGMIGSTLQGDVSGVKLQDALNTDLHLEDGAAMPTSKPAMLHAEFTYASGILKPRQKIDFTAQEEEAKGRRFEWLFGDGTRAPGRGVSHAFSDAEGTLLDGSGRFRVLLHVTDPGGAQAWSSQSIVLAGEHPRTLITPQVPNSRTPETTPETTLERMVHVPADGGYTFTLLTGTAATLSIDGSAPQHTPAPQTQVCGSEGNAVQPVRVSAVLTAGDHRLQVRQMPGIENTDTIKPTLLWEGPGLDRRLLPQENR